MNMSKVYYYNPLFNNKTFKSCQFWIAMKFCKPIGPLWVLKGLVSHLLFRPFLKVRIVYFLSVTCKYRLAFWQSDQNTHFPSIGSRVRVSVTPCGVHGGRIGIGGRFFSGSLVFPCTHFITPLSALSPHLFLLVISPCAGTWGLVNRNPCLTQIFIKGLHFVHPRSTVHRTRAGNVEERIEKSPGCNVQCSVD